MRENRDQIEDTFLKLSLYRCTVHNNSKTYVTYSTLLSLDLIKTSQALDSWHFWFASKILYCSLACINFLFLDQSFFNTLSSQFTSCCCIQSLWADFIGSLIVLMAAALMDGGMWAATVGWGLGGKEGGADSLLIWVASGVVVELTPTCPLLRPLLLPSWQWDMLAPLSLQLFIPCETSFLGVWSVTWWGWQCCCSCCWICCWRWKSFGIFQSSLCDSSFCRWFTSCTCLFSSCLGLSWIPPFSDWWWSTFSLACRCSQCFIEWPWLMVVRLANFPIIPDKIASP